MRLRIESQTLSPRARVALKHVLSLDDDEVERLAKRLPFEAQLLALANDRRERLVETVKVAFSEARIAFDPCPEHTRLATDQTCPRCQGRTCAACVALTDARMCPQCTKKARRSGTFKTIRIAVLLSILAIVALSTYADRRAIQSWERPISVVVYPMAYDQDVDTVRYAEAVPAELLQPVARFLESEAKRYGVLTTPLIEVSADHTVHERPPLPPEEPNVVDAIVYSLRLRWFAFGIDGPADVRLFVLYHRPAPGKSLPHSIGLERGHVGIVHAFAGDEHEPRNAVVVAHELLHTAGASDKYDAEGAPLYPEGYADPDAPEQTKAELMAASLPTAEGPRPALNLDECLVGEATAAEIGWRRATRAPASP